MTRRSSWGAGAAVALLVLASAALVHDHTRLDSPTMDEPFHALAAGEYVLSGTYFANLEHPPLAKLLAGTGLLLGGARAPRIPLPFDTRTAELPVHYVYFNAVRPERLMAAGRAPFLVLLALLVASAAWIAGRRGGPVAAGAAAAFLAFEPNLVAHAGVIHTDLAAALGFLVTVGAALAALERRSLALWAAAGVALGLSLAFKFSAVFLVPVLLLLVLARLLYERAGTGPVRLLPLAGLALAGAVAAATLLSLYAVAMRSMTPAQAEEAVTLFLRGRQATPAAISRTVSLTRFFPPLGHYVAGLEGIALQNEHGGGVNYLMGRTSVEGFPGYFLVAFLVKSSLGFLALLVAAALLWRRVRGRAGFGALALAVPVAVLFLTTLSTSYNIGVRHVLPVYPFLAVGACLVVVRAFPARRAVALLGALALLQTGETLAVHPHELSFFNAAAGGPSRGSRWLNDSNLDWGQDLLRLKLALEKRGEADRTNVVYFGGGWPPYYLPKAHVFDAAVDEPKPGLYAVSSFLMAVGPQLVATVMHDPARAAGYARLNEAIRSRGIPEGRVGYSILLYRLP